MLNEEVIRTRIAAAVHELGVSEASRRLGMRRETLLRLAAGGGVRRGSLLAAAESLGLLTTAPALGDLQAVPRVIR